jgi:hypothetical protein
MTYTAFTFSRQQVVAAEIIRVKVALIRQVITNEWLHDVRDTQRAFMSAANNVTQPTVMHASATPLSYDPFYNRCLNGAHVLLRTTILNERCRLHARHVASVVVIAAKNVTDGRVLRDSKDGMSVA